MAKTQKAQVVITANAAVAKKIMDELRQRVEMLKQKMDALDVTTAQGRKEFNKLQKEVISYNSAIQQNITNTERIDKAMKNLSSTSLTDLKRALAAAKSELNKMSATSPGLKQMQDNAKKLQAQIDSLTGSTKKASGGFASLIKHGAQMVAMYMSLNTIKSAFTDISQSLFKFSDQLADIRKVSNLPMPDISRLSKQLNSIDTRTSVEQINQLAYAGAKLGMANQGGANALYEFARASDQLNVALHEDLGDEAITQVSKMAQVMGDMDRMGVERSLTSIGSAVFKLASTSTANGENIVAFSKRLVGLGKASKMTTPEILALGSAADSMMLMPEVASTAMSKFITSLQTNYNLIEKNLKMEQGSIKKILEDPTQGVMGAITTVLEKMKETGGMNALNFMFKDMGSDGARLKNVMVTMSQNVDMLRTHLQTANDEFKKGTAIGIEYAIQQTTAAAYMDRASNLWKKAFVNSDDVDIVRDFAKAWYDFSKALTSSQSFITSTRIAFQGLFMAIKAIVSLMPAFIGYLGAMGIFGALRAIYTAGTSVIFFFTNLRFCINYLILAFRGLSLVMKANIFAAVIGGVIELISWIKDMRGATDDARKSFLDFKKDVKDTGAALGASEKRLQRYVDAIKSAKEGTKERNAAIKSFNDTFGTYLSHLLKETATAQDLANAYAEVANNMRRAALLESKEKGQKKVDTKYVETYRRLLSFEDATKGTNNDQYNKTWLQGYLDTSYASGRQIKGIAKDLGAKLGLSELEAENVYNMRGNATLEKVNVGKSGLSRKANASEQQLFLALRAAMQDYASKNAQRALDKSYDGLIPKDTRDNDDNKAVSAETPARDKEAEKAARAAQQAQNKEWRDQLKQVQADAEGLVNNVKAFFTRQLTEQTNYATSQNMSEAEKTAYMEPMNRQMQTTLAQLQMALSGHKNTWTDLSSALPSQILEKDDATGYNASRELAEAINKTKPEELYKKLVELSAHLDKPITATVAQWVKGASNADQTNAQADYKAQQARQQAALERNYTGKVQQTYTDQMYQYGFADMVSADKHDEQKAAMVDMFETARKHIAELMAMEPSDKNGILSLLFGTSKAPKDSMLKNVFALEGEDIKTFYETLIKYSDAYTEAEQKAYEKQKAIMEQRYALRQKDQEKLEQFYERFNKLYGASQSFGSRLGLVRANPDKDPEIQLYKSKMEFAKAYYDFVMKNSKNVQLQRAAENSMLQAQDAYSEQLVVKMKDRISKLQSFMQPTEEAIESLGDAWAEFQTSTEDGQKAMINVLKTLIKSYATMVIKNLRELAEKKLTDKMTESITGVPSELKEARSTDSMVLAEKQNFYKVRLEMEREFQQQLADIRNAYSEAHGLSPYKPKEKTEQPATEQPAAEQSSEEQTYWKAGEGWEGMKKALSPENEATPYDETKGPLVPAESEDEKQDALTEAVGEDADPTETLRTYDEAFLAETAHFHEQMLEEEQWYQEQLDLIKNGGVTGEDQLQAAIDAHEAERAQKEEDYEKELQAKQQSESDIYNVTKAGGKKLLSLMKKDDKKQEGEVKDSYAEQLSIVQDAKTGEIDWAATAEQTLTNILLKMIQSRTQAKDQEAQKDKSRTASTVTGEVVAGIAGGSAKTVESMGWWGLVLIPVITAALMALLSWALSSIGGGSSSSSATTNTKLVSGMLTYDEGNVQSFQGSDGHSYTATQVSQLSTGVVTSPIATTVNGVPSLVGEKGPEIVVGRETTAAIQRNDPELLSTLVNYDRLYSGRHRMRTLDEGNVSEVTSPLSSGEGRGEASDMTNLMSAILYRLENPIAPNINMYGRDGLHDKMQRANAFMKNKA